MRRLVAFIRHSTDALSEREFRLLWLGRSVSAAGDSLVYVALAFAVLGLTGSPADLGIVLAAYSLPRVVFILAGGVWADRLSRRWLMVGCDLARGMSQAVMAILLITGGAAVWHLVGAAVVMGAASAFFTPASVGLMPHVVSAGRLQQANALTSLSESVSHIFGPLASGLIVAAAGPGWAFAIDATSYFVSAAFLSAMRVTGLPAAPRRSFAAELGEGWREVRSRSWVVAALVTFSLSNISLAAFQILGPLVADTQLNGAPDWGLILTGGAIGGLVGGAIGLRWKPRRPLIPAFGIMLIAQVQLLMLIPPFPVPLVAFGSLMAVAAMIIANTFWDTMLQQHIRGDALGRVSAYDWTVSLVFQPLAFAVVGPLAVSIGLVPTLLIAVLISGGANMLVLLVPGVRSLTRREAEPVVPSASVATIVADATEPSVRR